MTPTTSAHLVDLAENDTSIFVHINKALLENESVQKALQLLRDLVTEPEEDVDEYGIPYVGDEEQAEIEAILDNMSDEDKEIAFVRTIEI